MGPESNMPNEANTGEPNNGTDFSDKIIVDELSDGRKAIVIDTIIGRISDHPTGVNLDVSDREMVTKVYQNLLDKELVTDAERPDIRASKDIAITAFEESYAKYLTPPVGIDDITFSMFDKNSHPLTENYPENAAGGFSSGHGLIILNIPYSDQLVSRASEKSGIAREILGRYLGSRMILHEYLHAITALSSKTVDGLVEKSGFQVATFPGDGTAKVRNIGLNEAATDYLAHQAILNQDPSLRASFSREGEQPRYKLISALIKLVGEKTFVQSYLSNDINTLRNVVNKGRGNQGRFEKVIELSDIGYKTMESDPSGSVKATLSAVALLKS